GASSAACRAPVAGDSHSRAPGVQSVSPSSGDQKLAQTQRWAPNSYSGSRSQSRLGSRAGARVLPETALRRGCWPSTAKSRGALQAVAAVTFAETATPPRHRDPSCESPGSPVPLSGQAPPERAPTLSGDLIATRNYEVRPMILVQQAPEWG